MSQTRVIMPASAGNLVVLWKILGPKDFIVLIYDSGNVQIFMCIHATQQQLR